MIYLSLDMLGVSIILFVFHEIFDDTDHVANFWLEMGDV
jgi:hypothetical protein